MYERITIGIAVLAFLLIFGYICYQAGVAKVVSAACDREEIHIGGRWWSLTAVDVTQHQAKRVIRIAGRLESLECLSELLNQPTGQTSKQL